MQINIRYDSVYLESNAERRMREKMDYFDRNRRPKLVDEDMNELEERVLEAYILCAYPFHDSEDQCYVKWVLKGLYRGMELEESEEQRSMENSFADYLELLFNFTRIYFLKKKSPVYDELKVVDKVVIPMNSMSSDVVVGDKGIFCRQDKEIITDVELFLSQVASVDNWADSGILVARDEYYWSYADQVFLLDLYRFKGCAESILVKLIYIYSDFREKKKLGVSCRSLNNLLTAEKFYRRYESLSVGYYPSDSFENEMDDWRFSIPQNDRWVKDVVMRTIYDFKMDRLRTPFEAVSWEEVEEKLQMLILRRFGRYGCQINSVETEYGFLTFCASVVAFLSRKSMRVDKSDQWIYNVMCNLGHFSYWANSYGFSVFATQLVAMLWLTGSRNSWVSHPAKESIITVISLVQDCWNSIGRDSRQFMKFEYSRETRMWLRMIC